MAGRPPFDRDFEHSLGSGFGLSDRKKIRGNALQLAKTEGQR